MNDPILLNSKGFSYYAYFMVAVIDCLVGMVYLFYPTLMPYHLHILRISWVDLASNYQILFLGLMRVVGAIWISGGVLLGFVVYRPFRMGEAWSQVAIPLTALIRWLILLYVTVHLAVKTSTWTPWPGCLLVILLLFFGILFSWRKKTHLYKINRGES